MKTIDLIPWKGFPHLLSFKATGCAFVHTEDISVGDKVYRGKDGGDYKISEIVEKRPAKGFYGEGVEPIYYSVKFN